MKNVLEGNKMGKQYNKNEQETFSEYFEINATPEAISQILGSQDYLTALEETYRPNKEDLRLEEFGEETYATREDLAADTEGFGEERFANREEMVESMDVDPDSHGQPTEVESRADLLYS